MKKLFLFAAALFLTHAAHAQDKSYEKIQSAGEIRCGYSIWNPILYKDLESGQIKGAAYDIMDAIGKKTDLKINFAEETGWGTLTEGLATGRYDMICTTIGALSSRGKVIDFSKPLFYLPIYVVVRKDEKRFDKSLAGINDPSVKLGVLEGEGTATFATGYFPKAKIVAIPQTADYSQLLEDVKTGKSDLTLISGETFDAFNRKNPGILKYAQTGKPIGAFRVAFGLPKGDYQLKQTIDTAIDELQDEGTLGKILDGYDPEARLYLRLATPYEQPK
ncbi:MAG: hypothetical protein DI586_09545 [Micavibrio aeruginosavorus]|uniref:Solute-binding protein family 3/N-terminal domain-containing protein n=1 Tax=Micavibrio aeruginosavorus TaxID=349221 RepID=A0A2W5HLB1_9BACT|nr:MAG: hypothetical protein DI586_09545 [Micavibrio aeruginosavorus]